MGFYENFPKGIHGISRFNASASRKRIQKALTEIVHILCAETFSFGDVTHLSVPHCTVNFDFGIAEADNFNYLDEEETNRTLKTILKKPFQIMDFFCAIRYYKTENKKKSPLKFDYYMFRFTFSMKSVEIQVFHERGPRHVSPEEIVNFVVMKINEKSSKRILTASPAT